VRRGGVDDASSGGRTGGDQARRALVTRKEGGRAMLRIRVREERQRMWRREAERDAMWDAVREGTAGDVAG
jgi:hypothetical protein